MKNENITSHGLSKVKRDLYMTVLRNSKELMDSLIGEEAFNINNMHFNKSNPFSREITFYGNIESENERRYISGTIYDLWSKIFIKNATVLRIGVSLEENGIYNFGEGFCRIDTGEVLRITRYDDTTYVKKVINKEEFLNPIIETKKTLVRGK